MGTRDQLKHYPFRTLTIPPGEQITWTANNPTFHRTGDYGIVVTDAAIYLFSPFWLWLARWRRYPLSDVRNARFENSRWCPQLIFQFGQRSVTFRTPLDDDEEMEFDRKNLMKAAELLMQRPAGP